MLFQYHEGSMHFAYEVRENGMLASVNLSSHSYDGNISEDIKKFLHGYELHLTGRNPAEHHGMKHHGGSATHTLKYRSHREEKTENGHLLAITLQDTEVALTQFFRFYTGVGAVRAWAEVKNISEEPIGLEYVASLSFSGVLAGGESSTMEKLRVLIPHNTWKREANWKVKTLSECGMNNTFDHISLNRIALGNTGTWSAKEYLPMGGLQNTETGDFLLWQIEHNGSWYWEIGETNAKEHLYLKLSGPTETENGWHKELAPNETFVSVPVAVAASDSFDHALRELNEYRRRIVRPRPAGEGLPVVFNDYMDCLRTKPTTENEKEVIDVAAEIGAECYNIDAGWYAEGSWWGSVGEWKECAARFPNGLREVTDYIRAKGMIPGMWIEPEVMGVNCPILDQFDDDCFFTRHGRRIIDHGRYQLDLRSEKVRRYLDETIDRLVRDYGLGFMKFDYNIDGGMGTEVNADSFGDGLLEHNRAYTAWLAGVMERHPHLIIENCASGGMRMDYAQLALCPFQSTTDQEDYRGRAYIARASATALLPAQAGTWSCPLADQDDDAIALNMINLIALRPCIGGQAMLWNEEQKALIAEGVAVHKSVREVIAAAEAFYPQGVPSYDDKWLTVGYHGAGRTVMPVWRMDAEEESFSFPLDGKYASVKVLYPQKTDAQVSVEGNRLTVTLPRRNSAVFVELFK